MRHSSRLLQAIYLLSAGCATAPRILASRDVCHEAVEPHRDRPGEAQIVTGLCGTAIEGEYQKCTIRVLPGDVICDRALWERYRKAPVANGKAPP